MTKRGLLVLLVFAAAAGAAARLPVGLASQAAAGSTATKAVASRAKVGPARPLSRLTADRGLTHGVGIAALSCPASNSCFAIDRRGRIFRYRGSSWSGPRALAAPASGPGRVSLSCSTGSACVAAPTGSGEVSLWDGEAWSEPASLSGAVGIEAVGCGRKGYCALIDAEGNSFALAEGSWRRTAGDWGSVEAISCVTGTDCVSGGTNGISAWNGAGWTLPSPHGTTAPIAGVSCPTPVFCMAVAGSQILELHGSRWSAPVRVEPLSRSATRLGTTLTAVSCPTASFCVAVDDAGNVLQWRDGVWSRRNVDPDHALTAISCAGASFCVLGDATGALLTARPR